MKKSSFVISTNMGFQRVEGYVTEDGKHGIDKRGKRWYLTDIATGIALSPNNFATRKEAFGDIERAEEVVASRKCRENKNYIKAMAELKEFNGVKTESEGKEMAKTNTKTSETKAKRNNYKAENEVLKREIEILKKQLEELTRVEKSGIDSFDVEKYLSTRDNTNRITDELVEALENTEGLVITRKGDDKWLYVSGKTADDTRTRKDIFKAMGFRWSGKESAWFLAPYPLANGKRWGAKKARKESVNA